MCYVVDRCHLGVLSILLLRSNFTRGHVGNERVTPHQEFLLGLDDTLEPANCNLRCYLPSLEKNFIRLQYLTKWEETFYGLHR